MRRKKVGLSSVFYFSSEAAFHIECPVLCKNSSAVKSTIDEGLAEKCR
jgi:hypothetical protein